MSKIMKNHMNKKLKASLIILLIVFVLVILSIYITPIIKHRDCYLAGGKWTGFPDSCVDRCGAPGLC